MRNAAAVALVGLLVAAGAAGVGLAARAQQGGDGDHQDTVNVCHFIDGQYAWVSAPETDFYGSGQQGHGTHERDIVPPFTIENPRPGDVSSFPGKNWDEEGQEIYD